MKRFLAIGECMIELAPLAEAGTYQAGFAGDTFNTAWYLRRLAGPELDVGYLSAVGDDAPSAQMTEFMRSAGITPVLTVREGRTVGLYMISLQDGERSFSYWRETSAARTLADDLDDLQDLEPGDMAFLSGITLAVLPPAGRKRLFKVLAAARLSGITVAFDPNLRPRLWADARTMREVITEAATVSDIVLPSFEDEADHFGDADPAATAARYAFSGARVAVVKNGEGPILLTEGQTATQVTPPPVKEVVDTTAAGDSFNAGFLEAYARGEGLEAAALAGCKVAGQVIGARGALVPVG